MTYFPEYMSKEQIEAELKGFDIFFKEAARQIVAGEVEIELEKCPQQVRDEVARLRTEVAAMKPCENQDATSWVCRYGLQKPEGACPSHTFEHREMNYGSRQRCSIRCMIHFKATGGN